MQEMRPSPFESARKGFSADAEVGRAAPSGDSGERDQAFSGRQSLGGEQSGRPGGHRKTLSLPANDLSQGRSVDRPRSSHPGTRRSHSLQQHLRERFSLHRGSTVGPTHASTCRFNPWEPVRVLQRSHAAHSCCQHMTTFVPGSLSGCCKGAMLWCDQVFFLCYRALQYWQICTSGCHRSCSTTGSRYFCCTCSILIWSRSLTR